MDPQLQIYFDLLSTVEDKTQVEPYVNDVLDVVGGKLQWFIDKVESSDHPLTKDIVKSLRQTQSPKLRL